MKVLGGDRSRRGNKQEKDPEVQTTDDEHRLHYWKRNKVKNCCLVDKIFCLFLHISVIVNL